VSRAIPGCWRASTQLLLAALLLLVAAPPAFASSSRAPSEQDSVVRVWVNTSTGVYHCADSRYYGTTKAGEYLSEREARSKGHRPAGGRICSLEAALASTVRVWVNTASGVYHCPGSKYYEKTKSGSAMVEGDALRSGHRPANGRACGSG
jgi:hypothetical protein